MTILCIRNLNLTVENRRSTYKHGDPPEANTLLQESVRTRVAAHIGLVTPESTTNRKAESPWRDDSA